MENAAPVILLVDDDPGVLETYRRSFAQFEPLLAHDGVAAQTILSAFAVDVVVCDLKMPGMKGLDLMKWAREHCQPNPEWIVVSGEATLDATIQALKLGAFDFICKPILSPMQLRTAVTNAARHKRLLAEVAERRALEVALRESERQVRQLVENIADLAWSATADGRIDFYNRRWYEYTGTTFEQMEGWGWRSVHHPALLEQVVERWTRALATGEPFEMEFPLRRADGVFRWFLTRVRPLRDADGRITRWFGTNTDIDEARAARSERERLIADLRQSVEARDEFLAIAAHELRTPLTALQLQLEGTAHLIGRTSNPGNDKLLGKLAVASRQVTHLGTLVNGLLDVARCIQGRLIIETEEVDLAEIVRAVVERCGPQAQSAGCALIVDAEKEVKGRGDRTRLDQVVSNLVGNSIKYGAGQPIRTTLHAVEGVALLRVEDRGIGIRPEDTARLFARFARAVSSNSYGGLGLGLYIARQIVEAHGGTIDVASEVGQGSTFTVRIPLVGPPAERKREASS